MLPGWEKEEGNGRKRALEWVGSFPKKRHFHKRRSTACNPSHLSPEPLPAKASGKGGRMLCSPQSACL